MSQTEYPECPRCNGDIRRIFDFASPDEVEEFILMAYARIRVSHAARGAVGTSRFQREGPL